jgi:hypothetical protein
VGDLEGSLNDGIKDYYPSKMNDVKVYNLGNGKRLEFFFNISNLYYDINFTVWNDSDKMQIDGNVKSIGGPILIKDINLVYHLDTGSSYYEAQDVTNTTNGWGIYANQMARDRNLMGYPKGETNISLTKYSINIPDGKYLVYAYLQALNTTSYYNFSFDFHNWFLINQDTNSPTLWTVHEKTYLGTADVKNGVILYEADSRDTYNGMVYIDGISVAKVDKLGNAYAIRWFDKIYDKMEQIIKSDKPIVFEDVQNTQVYDRFNARNRIVPNLKIKIYSSPTAESINVNYDFNVTLWNRIGWNNDTSGDLHSKYSQQPKYVYTPFNI